MIEPDYAELKRLDWNTVKAIEDAAVPAAEKHRRMQALHGLWHPETLTPIERLVLLRAAGGDLSKIPGLRRLS